MLTLWASPLLRAAGNRRARPAGVRKLTDTISVLDGGGSNVVAFSSADGHRARGHRRAQQRRQAAGCPQRARRRTPRSTPSSIPTTTSHRPATTNCSPRLAQKSWRTIGRVSGWRSITGCPIRTATRKRGRRPPGRPKCSSTPEPGRSAANRSITATCSCAHRRRHLRVLQGLQRACRRRRGVARERPRTGLDHRSVDRRARQCDGSAAEDRQRPDADSFRVPAR